MNKAKYYNRGLAEGYQYGVAEKLAKIDIDDLADEIKRRERISRLGEFSDEDLQTELDRRDLAHADGRYGPDQCECVGPHRMGCRYRPLPQGRG